ncbi:MAG: PAS domain-containing protein [Thiobacillus sp.]|nr:PAS domain-containing protein [Thiobacillus sp.]MDP3124072.1 PAS domain-containing protein [Thiobacillus sp.]
MKQLRSWLAPAHTIHRVVPVNVRQTIRLTLLLGLAFSVLLAIPFVLYHRAESENNLSLLQAEQERVIKLATGAIYQEMGTVLSDLRYLSQHNAIRNYLAYASDSRRLELATEYLGLARQKRLYDQVRFIGMDGMEEVRVNFNEGNPEIVADPNLQDKHDRYYFEETLWLSPGQIYVSPLDLNIEQGTKDQLLKPVIRFAAPVADDQGSIHGMVVLNYLGQRLRDKLSALEGQAGKIWLFNADGYWIMGPTPEDEWGFVLPERSQRSLAKLFPRLWQQMQAEHSGAYQSKEFWIQFERVYPLLGENAQPVAAHFARPVDADRYYWTIAVELSQPAMEAANIALLKKLWTAYGALTVFAFLVAGALALAINRNKALAQVVEKVVDNLPLLIAYVDVEQRYRFNNMAYERFFGLNPREIYGKTMRELLGEPAYQAIHPYIEQALTGEAVTFERQLANNDPGMQDLVISYLPDRSPQGEVRGFYVMVNDVSLIKESDRRDSRRMLELAHVSRLASMGEMASEIAHEINQPLAAIAMYSAAGQRVLQGEGDRSQVKGWLEAINTQAKRASEIVRRVRRFAQKGEHEFGPVDLNPIMREVAALLDHEAGSQQVEIVLELAENLPPVQGEGVLLEQVVFNLARYALDRVRAQTGERRITLRTLFDAQLVYVEVCDTGSSVDPAPGEHIFDSLVTGRQEGLGMGLSISRSIIEAHAGTLRYVMNPEGGNAFMFSLTREAQ